MKNYEAGREIVCAFYQFQIARSSAKTTVLTFAKRFPLLLTPHSKAADNYRLDRHNAFMEGTTPLP